MTPDLDSDEFVSFSNVAIFCANSETEIPVTDSDIDTIVRVNNDYVKAGELPVIHVGHNTPKDEKPILGYFSNFTKGVRNGVATIFAKLSVFKSKADELKHYPKRSAEVRLDPEWGDRRWKMPSLALLGSHEPRLNLGLVHFAHEGSPRTSFFSMDGGIGESVVSDELKEQILAVLAMTDVFAWAHSQMKEADAGGEEKPGDADKSTDSARASEGDEAMDDADKEKFAVMETELAALRAKLRLKERKERLSALEQTGAMFSIDQELQDSDDLNDEQFERRMKFIERTAQKAPIAMQFSVAGISAGGVPQKVGPDPTKVQAYARQHNVSFEAAVAALGV